MVFSKVTYRLALSSVVLMAVGSSGLPSARSVAAHNSTKPMTVPVAHNGATQLMTQVGVPQLSVTGVASNMSSAKIEIKPILGAQDYRVFDVASPHIVKYAGLRVWRVPPQCACHFAVGDDGTTPLYPLHTVQNTDAADMPTQIYGPNPEIEWNILEDGQPHTLVVQAVDMLGPMPLAAAAHLTRHGLMSMNGLMSHSVMIGSNEGITPDGKTSINGHGPSTNRPHVIAQSAPFVVQASATLSPIPSRSEATQTFLDTFEDSEAANIVPLPADPNQPNTISYLLNGGRPLASTVTFQTDMTDTAAANVMIVAGHFMDIVPSGGGGGIHMSFAPAQLIHLGAGRVLHATMEVDASMYGNRWMEFGLNLATPSNYARLTVRLLDDRVEIDQAYYPQRARANSDLVEATVVTTRDNVAWGGNGRAVDDRSRFDLFVGEHHLALFEDRHLIADAALPGPLGFATAQVQFRHFFYHSDLATALLDNGMAGLRIERDRQLHYRPWNLAQIVAYPFTDERHWDNLGFEVLPPAAIPVHWGSLAALIRMPVLESPHWVHK